MRIVYVAAVVLALLQPAVGRADASNDAKQHFEEATKLFNLGEFDHAATEYREAYKAKPDPVFLYNIAQSYRLGNNLQQAIFFYRSYLRNAPHAPNRREVEDRIHKLETQLALTSQPPNSPATPGSVGSVPPTTPEPEASAPPPPQQKPAPPPAVVTPPATTTTTAPAASGADLTATAPTTSERTPVYKKWWLWTAVGGVVVVGVALGVGLGVGLHGASAPSSHFGTTVVF